MRKLNVLIISMLLLLAPSNINSQTSGHSVVLTWILSTDDTAANCPAGAPCSQNVYRASGNCTATTNFQPLSGSTPVSGTWSTTVPPTPPPATFTDTTVTPGTWCYAVSFVLNGSESPKAVVLQPVVPAGVTGLAAH